MTNHRKYEAEQWFTFLRFCMDESVPVPDDIGGTDWKSLPPLLENAPVTFSHTMYLGYLPFVASLISFTRRTAS